MYINHNQNPKGKRVADCVIRALSKALSKDYFETFDEIYKLARENASTMHADEVWKLYLTQLGYVKGKQPYDTSGGGKRKMTVAKFAEQNPWGIFVISVAKHLTVIIDGNVYDTWNCSSRCVCTYFHISSLKTHVGK